MSTIIKKLPINKEEEKAEQKNIPLSLIDLSPNNYRTYYSQAALNELATDLTQHGMISPVTVRAMPGERYELVVGERRIRAAHIAGLEMIPAVIKDFTDEQAGEIRLAENLQRENPHPMDEANQIGKMHQEGKTILQIAERLSKSKAFIYSRLKLSGLIVPLQEIFFAEKLSLSEAMEIAGLVSSSQQEIFERHCTDWQDENFSTSSFRYIIGRYKYDLKEAPFDVQDAGLIPSAGACASCPFNSATLSTLFPEMATKAVCTNKACYHDKCLAQAKNEILQVLENQTVEAIICYGSLSEENQILIDSLEQTAGLPQHSAYDVTIIEPPTLPDEEDYRDDDTEDEYFDQPGYDLAMQEYQEDLTLYNQRIETGAFQMGLCFSYSDVTAVLFSTEKTSQEHTPKKVTAKQVQEAIKQGTQTPELLQSEVLRINQREERAKELDREKVQLNLHQQFCGSLEILPISNPANAADIAAARLIVYQALTYKSRTLVDESILVDENLTRIKGPEKIYQKLASLSESEYSTIIRLALCGQPESKIPTDISGVALYQLAGESGIDVEDIEKDQAKIAKLRLKKLKPRLKDLESQIKRMDTANTQKEAA